MPDISFTSDVIVGFPGETYEEFKETLSLVNEVEFASLFTFIYSPRGGTPAAALPDPVSRKEKGIWFDELLKAQDRISKKINNSAVGKTVRVLIEETAPDEDYVIGKSDGTLSVYVKGDKSLIGTFKNVKIESYSNVLYGTVIE